jgi:hypothetical protein
MKVINVLIRIITLPLWALIFLIGYLKQYIHSLCLYLWFGIDAIPLAQNRKNIAAIYDLVRAEYELKKDMPISGGGLSLPSDAEIHSMADEVSLRQDTRDRMIHAMGLEQGATWIRNNIREQLGSES